MSSIINYVLAVVMAIAFIIAILWATAPEQWYAGQHDSQHEGIDCNCYARMVNNSHNGK